MAKPKPVQEKPAPEKGLSKAEIEKRFETLLPRLDSYLAALHAYPDSKITGITYDAENLMGDTACFRQDNGKVVISDKILSNLEKLPEVQQAGCIGMVLKHEAWHSAYTKYWIDQETGTPTKAYLLNHLEDWRNHRFQTNYWPSCKPDILNLYAVLDSYRAEMHDENQEQEKKFAESDEYKALAPEVKLKIKVSGEIREIWDAISGKSAFSNLQDHIEVILTSKKWDKKTLELLGKALPHMLAFKNAQPSPYNKTSILDTSLEALQEAFAIFKIFEEVFDFEKEKEMMKGMSSDDLVKAIKDELERREKQGQGQPGQGQPGQGQPGQGQPGQGQPGQGQPGQGQPGQGLEKVPTEVLKGLLKTLEALQKMPNQGEQGDAQGISEEKVETEREKIGEENKASGSGPGGGVGYSDGSGRPREVPTDPVDERVYKKFTTDYANMIRYLRRMMANAKNHRTDERGHRVAEGKRGTRVRVRGVIEHLAKPSEDSKIMWQREGTIAPGKSNLVLEDLLIAVDGSGSMQGIKELLRTSLALICEGAKESRIPTSIVVSYDGAPEVFCEGRKVNKQEKVIRQLLSINPDGGTDMGNGSIGTLVGLRRQGSNPEMSRLIIVTDCCTSGSDLRSVSSYAKTIGYPTIVLALGTNDQQAKEVLKAMPFSSIICFNINSASNENIFKYLVKFCEWMSDPREFFRKSRSQPQLLSEFGKTVRVPNSSLLNGVVMTVDKPST